MLVALSGHGPDHARWDYCTFFIRNRVELAEIFWSTHITIALFQKICTIFCQPTRSQPPSLSYFLKKISTKIIFGYVSKPLKVAVTYNYCKILLSLRYLSEPIFLKIVHPIVLSVFYGFRTQVPAVYLLSENDLRQKCCSHLGNWS